MRKRPLDQVSQFVRRCIEGRDVIAGRVWLNDARGAPFAEEGSHVVTVISGLAEQSAL
jgi:hypothetical protein